MTQTLQDLKRKRILTQTKQFNHVPTVPIPTLERIDSESGIRMYTDGDFKFPSVTTMLAGSKEDTLSEWRNRVGADEAEKIGRRAALRGTKFHSFCEAFLRNEDLPKFASPLEMQVNSSVVPFLSRIDNVHLIETALYSKQLRLAGTVDCIAEFDGRLTVIDFKTSNSVKEKDWIFDYFLQATAYSIMFEELVGIAIQDLAIIIGVDGQTEGQLFLEKRDSFVEALLKRRDKYEKRFLGGVPA